MNPDLSQFTNQELLMELKRRLDSVCDHVWEPHQPTPNSPACGRCVKCGVFQPPAYMSDPIPVPDDFKLESVHRNAKKKRPVSESPPTEQMFKAYCESKGIGFKDSKYMWNHWVSNNWTRGGQPIYDWQAAIRAWNTAEYMPSQRKDRR